MSPLLSLRGLTRTFQVPHAPDLHILTGVDLDVEPGEHIAIVGRSGTGKSTLLKHLYRVHAVQEGRVTTRPRSATSPQMSRWNALLQYRSRRSARARTPHAVPCKRYVDNTGSIQLCPC